MKKEEEKDYVGKIDILIIANKNEIALKGVISELNNRVARSVVDAICDETFYDTRVSKNENGTQITFTDTVGEDVNINHMEERIEFMKHALTIIGEIVVRVSALANLRKDYEGEKKLIAHKEPSN